MRPLPGQNAWPRCQRPADRRDNTPVMTSSMSTSSGQMSFVFANESSIDSYIEHSNTRPRFRDAQKTFDFGWGSTVSARKGDMNDDDDDDDDDEEEDEEVDKGPSRATFSTRSESEYATAYSPIAPSSAFSHSPGSMISHQPSASRPITPMTLGMSVTGSALSSPSSRRNSLVDSVSEHAISSDEEEEDGERGAQTTAESGSTPQFIMPSIKMPSRRPFTATGKSMGRLKVLVAGDSGMEASLGRVPSSVCLT